MTTIWLTQSEPSVHDLQRFLRADFQRVCPVPFTRARVVEGLDWVTLGQKMAEMDRLIFTSGHAIRLWHARYPSWCADHRAQHCAAIGPTTGQQLQTLGHPHVMYPAAVEAGTEGLLAMLPPVPKEKIGIITGVQRRGVLETTLVARGHDVLCAPLYDMDHDGKAIDRWRRALMPGDVTVVASRVTLHHMLSVMAQDHDATLFAQCGWVVASDRLASLWAVAQPTLSITVAASMDHDAIGHAIAQAVPH